MIIDMGAENTDLVIADRYSVWLRSIPIGGNSFTETLVKSFKLSFAKAEDLKRNAGTSKYARQIFQAMRPVFADLVAEIQRSIGFYATVHREARIRRIIALGGTFRLPGLQRYLQQNLQLEVERMDSFAAGAAGRLRRLRRRSTRTCCRWPVPMVWRSRRWTRARSPVRCCRRRSVASGCGRKRPSGSGGRGDVCRGHGPRLRQHVHGFQFRTWTGKTP